MKKFIYILVIGLTLSLSFTSCTEEDVAPNTELKKAASGGTGSDPL
jgi:hypothetical protein